MKLINAFKHPESGRIFETKEQYDKHLVTYEARMARKRTSELGKQKISLLLEENVKN